MKKYILPIVASVSILINVVLITIMSVNMVDSTHNIKSRDIRKDVTYRKECAQNLLSKVITSNLYFPESYDPVSIQVDSVFHGPLTDLDCLKAAHELIDLKNQLPGAEDAYKEALHNLKIFGSSGVFWRHAEEKKNAEENLRSIKESIAKKEQIIKNRDSSHDGEFIGWQIIHRYRAKSQGGNISFSNVLYVVNPDMSEWLFRYSLESDSHNIEGLNKAIKQTLGSYTEE